MLPIEFFGEFDGESPLRRMLWLESLVDMLPGKGNNFNDFHNFNDIVRWVFYLG